MERREPMGINEGWFIQAVAIPVGELKFSSYLNARIVHAALHWPLCSGKKTKYSGRQTDTDRSTVAKNKFE